MSSASDGLQSYSFTDIGPIEIKSKFKVGQSYSGDASFNGEIRDPAIHDVYLSGAEIESLVANAKQGIGEISSSAQEQDTLCYKSSAVSHLRLLR